MKKLPALFAAGGDLQGLFQHLNIKEENLPEKYVPAMIRPRFGDAAESVYRQPKVRLAGPTAATLAS
jgi:hypothetical protein